MNIKTFLKCVEALPPWKSVLVKGDHGIGKSALVKLLSARIGLPVTDRRLSQMTEGDMIGLPFKVKIGDHDATRFAAMDWFLECCREARVLFLDEGNRASGEVIQAAFQVALDRELNGNKLHQDSRVFMAVNGDETKYQVNAFDPAFIDRWWVCELTPTTDEWLEWAKDSSPEGGNIHKTIVDFITTAPSVLDPPGNTAHKEKEASRRSWDHFNKAWVGNKLYERDYKSNEEDRNFLVHFASGFLGTLVAEGFVNYVKTLERFLTADDVMNNYDKNVDRVEKLSQAETNLVNNHIVEFFRHNQLTDTQSTNFAKWFNQMDGELATGLWMDLAKYPDDTTTNLKIVHPLIKQKILLSASKVKPGIRPGADDK